MTQPIGRTGLSRIASAAVAALAVVPSRDTVALFDDFLGDILDANWNYVEGTDAAPTDAAVKTGGIGGVLTVSTGDAGTGLAADLAQLNSFLNWRAANGDLVTEARVKLSAITNLYMFFGFTDVNTLEAPIESAGSADNITSNASDAVGFMFDTRMAIDNLWAVGVKADVDAVKQNLGIAPVAGDYVTLRVQLTAAGEALFFVNGVQVGTQMAAAVTPTVALTPTFALGNTSGTTAKTADVDYLGVSMKRNRSGNGVAV